MADVFVSYARATEELARRIAEALRKLGYSVWRDDELPAHRPYADVIEERLRSAKAVVVVWSKEAVKSQWVRAEADLARLEGKLVQLSIDGAQPPLPFNQTQFAIMDGWHGDEAAPSWRKIVDSVAALVGQPESTPLVKGLPALPSRPSIAVLPFINLSHDPEQDYFTEGIVEEIVASLARFKSLFVIAAGADLLADGRPVSPQEAAHQLGVRYLLKGSVRKAGDRVRIAVHLVEAESGAEIWTNTLNDTMDDIFALQDRVAEHVAGVLETAVQDQDIINASDRPTANMNSYDLYLRAMQLFRLSRKDEMKTAIDLLDRAIELDPNFAIAISQACVCHRQMIDHRWIDDIVECRKRGLDLVERALAVAGIDTRVLAQVAASLPGLEGRTDRAIRLIERAIALNPSSSFVWLISGSIHLRDGQPDIAAEHLETSMRLDPISASANAYSRMYLASARFQQGRFDEAMTLFETTSLRLPVSYIILAALYGYLGRPEQAREALSSFENASEVSVEDFARIWFWRPSYRKLLMNGLAFANGARDDVDMFVDKQ